MGCFTAACGAPACSISVPAAPSNAFNEFLASPNRAGRFLVEVDLYPKDAVPVTRPSLPACGAPACSIEDPSGTVSEAVQLRLSDHPVFMSPTDSLRPNYVPDARLARRIDIDTAFSVVPTTSEPGQVLIGDVEIFNDDGWLDDYVNDYSVDGRTVRILFGPENGAYSEFRELESAFGLAWQGDESSVRLSVQDLQFRLDQPFQTSAYAGTGGIEGTSSLAGQLKPRLIGHRYNFTPVLIDPSNNVYQISESPIYDIVEVRDGGEPLTDEGTDASTYAALIGASLDEGEWCRSSNLGLLRIYPAGGSLASVLSVEAKGDSTDGYTQDTGDLIVRELRNRAGFVDTEIDAGSFAPLNAYDSGYWFNGEDDSVTFRDVIKSLTKQTNGRLIADSKIRAIRIIDPSSATYNYTLQKEQIVSIEPDGVIYPPVVKTLVRYRPNDTALADTEIVGSIDDDKQDMQKEYLETYYRDASVLLRHKGAQKQIVIDTDLIDEDSAITLAASVGELWRTERQIYRVTANREALFFTVGSVVQITHPRYGFSSGRNALIVQRVNDYNNQQAELVVLV